MVGVGQEPSRHLGQVWMTRGSDCLIWRARGMASTRVSFGDEVKSGGNGVAIVALAKLIEITGEQRYVVTVRALAEGLLLLQSQDDGAFPHVMRFPTMQLVERHRTIYYDGEALFGLLKAFEVTKDSRYLEAARRAANHFVRLEHWRAHDHWLAYGLNELTRYEHDERFFLLALRNVGRHVRFVKERLTAYPTLLELCMASLQTVSRMKSMGVQPRQIDSGFSEAEVLEALHMRAKKLFSAHMFPELAMFFRSPGDIVGSFAIRHYSFRIASLDQCLLIHRYLPESFTNIPVANSRKRSETRSHGLGYW